MQQLLIALKNFTLLLLIISIGHSTTAQEGLFPLRYNQTLKGKSNSLLEKSSDLHLSFVYLNDTLSLPFIDDFSRDHFPKFNADSSDSNVSDTTWFHLTSGGVPFSITTSFMTDTTYNYQYDTVPGYGFDSIVETKIALASSLIDVSDLSNYPVTTTANVEVWPTTYTIDSLWTGSSPDLTFTETNPDLIQDSLTIYFVHPTSQSSNIYWTDDYAYLNETLAVDPLTIGVVTFDGINENGYPYDWSSANAAGKADVLTSKPIDLSGLSASDSIYFSFFYQEGGLGEAPDAFDSLTLEFWSPVSQTWYSVWSTTGGNSSTTFNNVLLNLTNVIYFQKGFQFKFTSYGSLTGSIDLWHIDYVILDKFRSYDDVVMQDWAFQYPAPSLINIYTSMPWPHYYTLPFTSMKTSTSVATYNSSNSAKLVDPSGMEISYQGNVIDYIAYDNTGASANVTGQASSNMDYNIPTSFWFDTTMADTCATFDIQYTLSTPTTPERLTVNDTLNQEQYFCNYYSYDDGSAEAAYGLAANGALLAYQFTLPSGMSDSIRAISIHFESSVNDASGDPFFLQIWDDAGGAPGNLIYTTDDSNLPLTYIPQYNIGVNGFYEYVLPERVLVSGIFYVGWKQTSSNRLNIGFDKNINNQSKIFYNLSSSWSNTVYQGSLMMRPVFISDQDALFASVKKQKDLEFTIYPNPAQQLINVEGNFDINLIEVLDLSGRTILPYNGVNTINIESLSKGIYLIKVYDIFNNYSIKKFMKN